MKLVKELQIFEVKGTMCGNAPFTVEARINHWGQTNIKSIFTMDMRTAEHWGIKPALELAGQTLVVTVESREFPLDRDRPIYPMTGDRDHPKVDKTRPPVHFVDWQAVTSDDFMIDELKLVETSRPILGCAPPMKHEETQRTLALSSSGAHGDGMHPSPTPCPCYKTVLSLTEEEYAEAKALPPQTIFRLHLALKPAETPTWPPRDHKEPETSAD